MLKEIYNISKSPFLSRKGFLIVHIIQYFHGRVFNPLDSRMRLLQHRKYSAIFKGIVVLAYLVLLGSQLSRKFYVCANSPSRAFKGRHSQVAHIQLSGHGTPLFLDHKKSSSLSLDKRYEFKHVFALVDPVVYLPSYILPAKQAFSSCCRVFIQSYSRVNPLRGPPSV